MFYISKFSSSRRFLVFAEDHGNSLRTAIIIVVPTVFVVLVLLIVITRYLRRKARKSLLTGMCLLSISYLILSIFN